MEGAPEHWDNKCSATSVVTYNYTRWMIIKYSNNSSINIVHFFALISGHHGTQTTVQISDFILIYCDVLLQRYVIFKRSIRLVCVSLETYDDV